MDLANWDLRTALKFTTGVKYRFHQVFFFYQIRDPEIPINPRPYIYIYILYGRLAQTRVEPTMNERPGMEMEAVACECLRWSANTEIVAETHCTSDELYGRTILVLIISFEKTTWKNLIIRFTLVYFFKIL